MMIGKDAPFAYEVDYEWIQIQIAERPIFQEVYGFSGSQGTVNLAGVRMVPRGRLCKTLVILMHPSTSVEFLPMPGALAKAGVHVLCAGNRFARNDTPLIMEKVAVDMGAYVSHARQKWGYENVVLLGWSGGGSLSLFYQSQALKPTITHTPAGDLYDLTRAALDPADAVIFQAANVSRASLLRDWMDPSVLDENHPEKRDLELDIYHPNCPNKPPYSQEFISRYRGAQLARMRRRTDWAKDTLDFLRGKNDKEQERGFVTHRTMADLRFFDSSIDPNDRLLGQSHVGDPESSNSGPAGLARFSTLRSWLSQWSIDDTNVNGPARASSIDSPLLVIENTADEACPATDPIAIFEAAISKDKTFAQIRGATHYYQGQPEKLAEAVRLVLHWMAEREYIEL